MTDIPVSPTGNEDASALPPLKETVRGKKKSYASSTQRYLPIAEIKEDTLVLKNGGLRAILKVNSLNFNLKSEVEQQGIIAGYQSFVNTLIFPIQIVVRSSRINIDPYLKKLEDLASHLKNELLKTQTLDYASFMEKLVDVADIMQKNFYIIVPMDSGVKQKRSMLTRFFEWLNVEDTRAKALQRNREFKNLGKVLRDRVTLIQSGLENIGITMKRLSTDEIVRLFYTIYNPETSQKEKLGTDDEIHVEKSVMI